MFFTLYIAPEDAFEIIPGSVGENPPRNFTVDGLTVWQYMPSRLHPSRFGHLFLFELGNLDIYARAGLVPEDGLTLRAFPAIYGQ